MNLRRNGLGFGATFRADLNTASTAKGLLAPNG